MDLNRPAFAMVSGAFLLLGTTFTPLHAATQPPQPAVASSLTAGSARAEISPSTNILNWVGHDPYPGILDPVFARAVVLSDGSNRIAIVAWDLTDTREGFVARTRRAVEKATGIPAHSILLNASHTHSAPWVPSEGDFLLEAERRTLLPVQKSPGFKEWGDLVVSQTVDAVRRADAARRPVTLTLARAWAGDLLFNRRPVRHDGRVETTFSPTDPHVLPDGQKFGPMDPSLTLLALVGEDGRAAATLFNLPCHPVSIYPHDKRVSADWPGPVSARLSETVGGESLFLQGCAGDIVPIRRNLPARDRMAQLIGDRALVAWERRHPLPVGRIASRITPVHLPFNEAARKDTGLAGMTTEVQAVVLGDLAIVTLPGEPLTALNLEIQRRSPYPQTVVLGYSNGGGVQYVGATGDKVRGGYEMGVAGSGEDPAGQTLVDAVLRTLESMRVDLTLGAAAREEVDLYLLIGQSNMAGRGPVESIDQVPHPRVFTFDPGGQWRMALDPLHQDRVNAGVGLGSAFGRAMADASPGRWVGLIPSAVGGTPLSRWVKGGDLYQQALSRARKAQSRGRIRGILWHQGENDSDTRTNAASYGDRLAGMIRDLRADLGEGDIPFIAGELGEFLIKGSREDTPLAVVVNDQLHGLRGTLPAYACVESAYLTALPDAIHFDSPSLREFGRRYARAMLSALSAAQDVKAR